MLVGIWDGRLLCAVGMVAQHRGRMRVGFLRAHAAGAVDQFEFVGVHIELGERGANVRTRRRRFQKFALRTDRHVLAGPHRQCTREQPGQPGHQHGVRRHPAGTDAQDQRQIAHQSVVGAEDRGTETARQPVPAAGGQCANHLFVDLLVGGHRRSGVGVAFITGARLEPLNQRQDEHRPEVARQEGQHPGA